MIASYMDESFDMRKSGVFVAGGLLGRGLALFELERRWERLRKRWDIGIRYFKASECEHGRGEFAKFVACPGHPTPVERQRLDSISREFVRTIVEPPFDDNRIALFGVGVDQKSFYDLINKSAPARAILGDSPYRLAYDLAIIECAWAMRLLGTGDTVSFVSDERASHSLVAQQAYSALKDRNPNASTYLGSFWTHDEKKCEPLQAADAVVFEVRRALRQHLRLWSGNLRQQFSTLTNARALWLIAYADREHLLTLINNHRPGEPFKLDSLIDFNIDHDIQLQI